MTGSVWVEREKSEFFLSCRHHRTDTEYSLPVRSSVRLGRVSRDYRRNVRMVAVIFLLALGSFRIVWSQEVEAGAPILRPSGKMR